jgi:hypothetical protein
LTGLKRYKLVVVSFLNLLTAKETKNRFIEEKFFERNRDAGEYKNWVVLGSVFDPNVMPYWVAKGLSVLGDAIDFDEID